MLKDTRLNTVIDKHKCTMCGACLNVCPVNAITVKEDDDGFAYPHINKDKCTNCGLCTKRCPALHPQNTSEIVEKLPTPVCYGGYSKNDEVREKSSSGGVFSILADYVLSKGGYVCGAKFVKGATLEHVIINNKEDLAPLRGSKYVQSNVNDVYKKIKKLLEKDSYVLFTGTPCQVAALYQVLGKDYEKLLTVDLLCTGCPSQKIFKQHLNEITDNNEENITEIKFRDKRNGWRDYWVTIKSPNKSTEVPATENAYMTGFTQKILIRKACTDCHFNRLPRQGDFTLGDFWGVEHQNKDIDDNKGTSAILVNTTKAQNILTEIKSDFQALKNVPQKNIQDFNMVEWKSYPHPHREYFFAKYRKGEYTSVNDLINETINKTDGIALLNYSYSKDNYGSVLTAYALQEKLRQKGYSPVNIIFYDSEKLPDMSNLGNFTKKHIAETAPCWSSYELKNLNKYFKTFIVGPDTVWTNMGFMQDFYNNFFNFATFSKNICSYAASFGGAKLIKYTKQKSNSFKWSEDEIAKAKYLLKRFCHIGVREKSALKICKDIFDVKATHVLDAVFLLSAQDWKTKLLQNNSSTSSHNKIVKYILNANNLPPRCKEHIASLKNSTELFVCDNFTSKFISTDKITQTKGLTIESWLNQIANCQTLITDSFHGMCFAIIFNKQFIVFNNLPLIYGRHKSLMEMLNIPDRTAYSKEDFDRLLKTPIDYKPINQKLSEELKRSENFLDKILTSHNSEDKIRSYLEALELRIEIEEEQQKVAPPPLKQTEVVYFGFAAYQSKIQKRKDQNLYFGSPSDNNIRKEEHKTLQALRN